MGDQQRKARGQAFRPVRVIKTGGSATRSTGRSGPGSSAKGNQDANDRLEELASDRDGLLDFIRERLGAVASHHGKETQAVGSKKSWKRRVGLQDPLYHTPEPSRWNPCATLYKQAVQALCAGNLGRGVYLLAQALDSEQASIEQSPENLKDEPAREAGPLPESALLIGPADRCPGTRASDLIALADSILLTPDRGITHIRTPGTPKFRCWQESSEEEDEDDEEELPDDDDEEEAGKP